MSSSKNFFRLLAAVITLAILILYTAHKITETDAIYDQILAVFVYITTLVD